MSHLHERKEKNCLNCQAEVVGRYCHQCGQENLEPKETVWHLVQHFFNDITHFDGKFFETVKYLLRKPGFLSREYMRGRRMSYLNPIRMYVFTSAIFFIILFSLKRPGDMVSKHAKNGAKGVVALLADQTRLQKELQSEEDEDDREEMRLKFKNEGIEIAAIKRIYGDSTKLTFDNDQLNALLGQAYADSLLQSNLSAVDAQRIHNAMRRISEPNQVNFFNWHGEYRNVEEYDSSERALPDSLRDGWIKKTIMRRLIYMGEEYKEEPRLFEEHLIENIFHSFPKILFVSLPIFALILNILYFRHKQYYYVDHGIFAVHLYCATFILLLVAMLLSQLKDVVGPVWIKIILDILIFADCVYLMIYLYKAMRGFYQQRRGKTFLKYMIIFSVAGTINAILTAIFMLISVFSV
ncbi:MAG TPA: DUF3667 domain-containing protein [Puia sp.]|nr:DUF3667 domain-containing protein [Puia sp.]